MSLLTRLFAATPPAVALEVAPGRVTGLRLSGGPPPVVEAHATVPLAAGVVTPSLVAPNLVDPAAVADAMRRVLRHVGGSRRVALVVPDDVARVSLVRFDTVPARQAELEAMLRWQVRKSVPFRTEDAQMTWAPGLPLPGGGREFLVVLARRDVVAQYEAACEQAGAHAGVVDLATLNLVNLVLAAGEAAGDWLLVHVTPVSTALAIVRDQALAFYRHRGAGEEESLEDLVHQTAMYYEDRLSGRGFARVLLAGASLAGEGPAPAAAVQRQIEQRLGVRVERVDPEAVAAFTDRIEAGHELRDRLAPGVGLLARERTA